MVSINVAWGGSLGRRAGMAQSKNRAALSVSTVPGSLVMWGGAVAQGFLLELLWTILQFLM